MEEPKLDDLQKEFIKTEIYLIDLLQQQTNSKENENLKKKLMKELESLE